MPDKLTMGEDTKKYWFVAKRYGIGWQPSSWQGWLVTVLFVGFALFLITRLELIGEKNIILNFILPLIGASIALTLVCVRTGEPLKWRWGKKK